jgi:prolipoprotein diacylglyceryltransferase
MIVIAGFILGAFWGWRRATARDGNRFDHIQYALAYSIAFALVGMFLTIAVERML